VQFLLKKKPKNLKSLVLQAFTTEFSYDFNRFFVLFNGISKEIFQNLAKCYTLFVYF